MRRRSVSSLRFTWAAGANAAAELRHALALAGQPRQLVLELRQLHLQHALAGAGVAREDVEDELGAVDHRARQPRLNVARLRRRQVVVEQHQAGAVEATVATISSSLPPPTSVAASGLGLRWISTAAISLPRDRASSWNSASEASKSMSAGGGQAAIVPAAASPRHGIVHHGTAARACCAAGVSRRRSAVNSTATSTAALGRASNARAARSGRLCTLLSCESCCFRLKRRVCERV